MSVVNNARKIRISSVDQIKASAEIFRDVVTELCGLQIAASHNIARNKTPMDKEGNCLATTVFGWGGADSDSDWWKTEGLALDSPIAMACRYESEPFWINEHGIYARHENPFIEQVDLGKFKERAKIHAAITVPVHLPFGQIGAVSFNPVSADEVDLSEKFDLYCEELSIYARTFIRSYINAWERTPILPIKSKLSKREAECLRWAALGKTDQEIAMIIDRSRATIRFHIRNATEKLDAVNKSQAVFKATQLGYISANKE